MDEIMYQKSYFDFKRELDQELNKAADGFVKIGYLLRQAEDTDVLESSGYRNVAEFAQIEYGLSKDIVSRYININKRFSEGGYSDSLADKYRGFGMAKLAEMLTLPPALADAIPDDLSKAEIREIKKEYDAEQQITDIEVAIEQAAVGTAPEEDIVVTVTKQWLHDAPEDFEHLFKSLEYAFDVESMKDIVAPSGTRVIIVRIAGIGKYMMTCQMETGIELVNMRNSEKVTSTWNNLCNIIGEICEKRFTDDAVEDVWRRTYNEEFPVKEEPKQPVQEKNEEKKPEKRKESKVTIAKKEEKKQVNTQYSEKSEQKEKEEVVPVQPDNMNEIELDGMEPEEIEVEIIEPDAEKNQVNTRNEENLESGKSATLDPYIEMMDDAYKLCVKFLRMRDIDKAAEQMERLRSEYGKAVLKIEEKMDE